MTIKILLVDDHTVVRSGLSKFLMVNKDLKLVGEASDGAEAVQMVALHKPDVVLMDLMMPGVDGIIATREIHRKYPQVKVIALTSFSDQNMVQGALQAGAAGYLRAIRVLDQAEAARHGIRQDERDEHEDRSDQLEIVWIQSRTQGDGDQHAEQPGKEPGSRLGDKKDEQRQPDSRRQQALSNGRAPLPPRPAATRSGRSAVHAGRIRQAPGGDALRKNRARGHRGRRTRRKPPARGGSC